MHFSSCVFAAAAVATASAQYIGSNYASTFTDGSAKQQSDFEAEFNRAKSLEGTNGAWTSARLYTMIQAGTADTPISAIPAAIDTQTTLLLGLWGSAGQDNFNNELTALTSAITQYGTAFTDLIAGISVGSEDLYRNSPTGTQANGYNAGADPDVIVSYINQVKSAISGTDASGASVGHVDTWTAWVNGTNDAVITACDWLGMDAYPYFQTTIANSIELGNSTFYEAYDNTVAVSNGKDVWVTETGWPVSGPTENQAVASIENAETYWQDVYCSLAGNINVWWYILQDAAPTTPSPSFGIIGSDISSAPLYNLTCSNGNAPASSASSSVTSSAVSTASSATMPASSAGPNTESLSNATPASETSPTSATIDQTTRGSASATGSAATTTAASSGLVTSGASYGSGEASSTVSAKTSASTTVVGGQTYTIYQTTMVTITNCPGDCSTTMSGTNQGSFSVPAPTSYASASSASVGAAAPSPASSSATTPAAASGTACPASLSGEYQYPHLIGPVNKDEPSTAYGTQYNGTISPSISTIFNFDLPASYAGQTCSLVFLFPEQAALETSAFTFNGQGGISVNELSSPATAETTYASVPSAAVAGIGAVESVQPGNSYVVASHECAAGKTQSFEFMSTGGLDLEYFQDWNPSPIGAYITVC